MGQWERWNKYNHGLLATVAGGIAWLLALKGIYGISWTRAAIIAVIIWIVSYFVAVALTAPGPLWANIIEIKKLARSTGYKSDSTWFLAQ